MFVMQDNSYHNYFTEAILEGNYSQSINIINQFLFEEKSKISIYEDIIRKSLYDVGTLWEYNRIDVATEHLASATVDTILNDVFFRTNLKNRIEKTALLTCIEEEQHQIGLKLVNDIFKTNGWKTLFLGANTPVNDLFQITNKLKPEYLCLSVSISFNIPKLQEILKKINSSIKNQKVLIGGQAFNNYNTNKIIKSFENVEFVEDLHILNEKLQLNHG